MKETTVRTFCDACGKEVISSNGHFYSGNFHMRLNQWGGGSMGGSEDIFEYEASDLCEECAHKLENFIKNMGIKRKPHQFY